MHPLSDDLKALSFEDLEKRSSQILKRMQILRRNGITTSGIWDQLEMLLNSINDEKIERAMLLNNSDARQKKYVVVNTDPLEDDDPIDDPNIKPKTFTPIS